MIWSSPWRRALRRLQWQPIGCPNGKVTASISKPSRVSGAQYRLFQCDIASVKPAKIKKTSRRKVPLCDLRVAPKLSGIRDADTARCLELNRTALDLATALLRRGGTLLIKSFINQELQSFTLELKNWFAAAQRIRPEAPREGSSEFYFCAKGFRGTPDG